MDLLTKKISPQSRVYSPELFHHSIPEKKLPFWRHPVPFPAAKLCISCVSALRAVLAVADLRKGQGASAETDRGGTEGSTIKSKQEFNRRRINFRIFWWIQTIIFLRL